jgi:hypothetical protein
MWGGFKKQVSSTYDSLPMDSKYQSIVQEFEIWFADSEQREDRIYWLRDELNDYMVISNGNKDDCLVFGNPSGSIDELFSLIPEFEYQRASAQDFNGLMYGYLLGLLPGWILVGGDLYTEEVQSFSQDHFRIIRDFGLDNKGYQVTTYHWGKDGAEYRCDSYFSPYQNKRTDVLVGIKK